MELWVLYGFHHRSTLYSRTVPFQPRSVHSSCGLRRVLPWHTGALPPRGVRRDTHKPTPKIFDFHHFQPKLNEIWHIFVHAGVPFKVASTLLRGYSLGLGPFGPSASAAHGVSSGGGMRLAPPPTGGSAPNPYQKCPGGSTRPPRACYYFPLKNINRGIEKWRRGCKGANRQTYFLYKI
jgi:hypothetical protein